MQQKIWFKAKRLGWGWYPVSWQGWSITTLYIASIISYALSTDLYSHSVSDTLIALAFPFIILTGLLIAICYLTGEKPEWRWIKKDS